MADVVEQIRAEARWYRERGRELDYIEAGVRQWDELLTHPAVIVWGTYATLYSYVVRMSPRMDFLRVYPKDWRGEAQGAARPGWG